MLSVTGLEVFFDRIRAIREVYIEVNNREVVSIIGANGAGKSTLLKAIMGSAKIAEGSIIFNGEDITRLPSFKRISMGISFVPEGKRLFPKMSVVENLQMGKFITYEKKTFNASLERIFKIFPILQERIKQTAGTLSGGEQQMLAIGRALVSNPMLLLLDEPTLGLAPLVINEIFRVLEEVNNSGITILIVEQNARKALIFSHRTYVMETGRVVLQGLSKELIENPQVKQAFLGKR
jgi:branched-chain amino acid transport system ATP-binding protein